MPTLPELLKTTVDLDGSDLHLSIGTPPQVRVHGELRRLEFPDLTPTDTKALAYSVLTDAQKKRFEESLELDFSFGIRGIARFRCNLFNQKGAVGAVYRQIPEKIRSFEELALPGVIAKLAERPRGLVLITGPTGSGKSTTLAAMIDKINTRTASSTSARCTATPRASPTRFAPPCVRTPTSSSSAKCATSKRWSRR
jgi:twitching motility protein PilT